MMICLTNADKQLAWCPGCGNYAILKAFNAAIAESGIEPKALVLVSGIGQAAKFPHYVTPPVNIYNGLHGRALPAATGIKLANHKLKVVVTSGDGDMYGEGGNHFITAVRRNIGVVAFVHDNQVYALTKGQASPTSDLGFVTKIQTHGVMNTPFNPLALAIVEDASFVARSFSGDFDHLKSMMLAALHHPGGFALLDILQPCVSFNKVNTYKWYKEHVQYIDPAHDPRDKRAALELALQWGEHIPIGILYKGNRPSLEMQLPAIKVDTLVAQLG